uniref:WWE domain-containing protein n=1 Tax=Alexandrium monilatum TaxID=311494 RepID=A0A7S4VKG7_9DINO
MEYQETWGQQEFSQGYKMTFSMIANTALVVLFINFHPRDWFRTGGLVADIFYMLIVDSIVARLCLFFDMTYTFNYFFRQQLTDEKIQKLNDTMEKNYPPKSPEQEEAIENLVSEIDGYKQAFEPEEIDNPDRYARVLTTFLCSVFFAPVLPAAPLIGTIGLLLQYVLDKILLLKWFKRPRPQNEVQAMWSMLMLKYLAPFALSAGVLIFLMPLWKEKRQVMSFFIASLFISLIMAIFPARIMAWFNIFGWISRLWRRRRDTTSHSRFQDYYHAQHMWPKDMIYHLDQPLYKQLYKAKKGSNPGILRPDQDHLTQVADLKAKFTASVKDKLALQTVVKRGVKQRGRHHRRLTHSFDAPKDDTDVEVGAEETTPAAPAVPICLRAGCGKPTWNGEPNQHCGRTCRDMDRKASSGISVEEITMTPAGADVQWQFEAGSGFQAYAADCQEHISSRYQAFLQDRSKSQATIRTGDTVLSIDFVKMTQRVEGGRRERRIRRIPPP